ncbi:hypothetical protein GCM10010123_46450 [Pilimelia anulata]|uniref:Uncharacterized protein n=1 Tax=Pilimelia anulata TaxID=53371 RepID=A0A8J3BKV9_9ACTN|nr:hypothetical protein GCM10010123_46450 [Pilimelia anulata]
MPIGDRERHSRLPRWITSNAGNPQLHDEAATGREVPCSVAEALDLLSLGTQVGDAVPHHIHQRERARHRRCGHVTDDHRDLLCRRLPTKLIHHRLRQLNPGHRHSPLDERNGHPPGTDGELQGPASVGEPGQEIDDWIKDRWAEHRRRRGVVSLRSILVPQITTGHSQQAVTRHDRPPPIYAPRHPQPERAVAYRTLMAAASSLGSQRGIERLPEVVDAVPTGLSKRTV